VNRQEQTSLESLRDGGVLVSGASRKLGADFARELVARGYPRASGVES